ncbi:hypothetical protein QEM_1065 [Clostridioides difficile CD132]|nr:hypothetical protein QEM_1065 [Clostridioides difficile CD132]
MVCKAKNLGKTIVKAFSFILTKWYVKKNLIKDYSKSFDCFILTKWYVKNKKDTSVTNFYTVLY